MPPNGLLTSGRDSSKRSRRAKMRKPRQMRDKHPFKIDYKSPLTHKKEEGFAWAKVLIPELSEGQEYIPLAITPHGVLRSKRLKGRASTQLCSGAVCSVEQHD